MENPNVGSSIQAGPLWKAVRVWAGLEQNSLARTEACLLGGFAPGAWADCGVVADTIEDLAARRTLCVLVQKGDAMWQGCSGEVGGPVEERGVGSSYQPISSSGDLVSVCGMLHQGAQRVRVAQVGHVALGACRAVWAPSCVLVDVAAELSVSCGPVKVVSVVVSVPKAVAQGGCAAAGGQDAESALLGGDLGGEPSLLSDGSLNDSSKATPKQGCGHGD